MNDAFVLNLAKSALTATDREFWPLMALGKATCGEFGFREAVDRLTECGVTVDPEGHIFLWLEQGYIWCSNPVFRADSWRLRHEGWKALVKALHVTSTGETVADMTWPDGEDRANTTFGYNR